MSHSPDVNGLLAQDEAYSQLDMDLRGATSLVFAMRTGALTNYLNLEREAHRWHGRIAQASCEQTNRRVQVRPGKHVPGGQIITETYPGVHYDPGDFDARRIVRLTRTFRRIQVHEGRPLPTPLEREVIPGIDVYRLGQRSEELVSSHALDGWACMDHVLRGTKPPADVPNVWQLFISNPAGHPDIRAYHDRFQHFEGWLGIAAVELSVDRQDVTTPYVPPPGPLHLS